MDDDTIQLRQPTDDADVLRAYLAPIGATFGEAFDEADFEAERQIWELDRTVGAVDGERWVGGGAAYTYRLTVPGRREVGAAAITGIGVSPDYRRRGILTRMMRWLLDQAAERGEPVAVLHASEGAIYPRFGFGLATLQGTFDIDRNHFRFARPAEPLGRVRLVDRDEAMGIIPAIYDEVRLATPGWVSRSAAKWRAGMLADGGQHLTGRIGSKSRVVLEVDGRPRGYAIYRVKGDWDERGPKNEITVVEVTGLDPAAERALWEWLAAIDLVARVKGWRMPVPHPLLLQLQDLSRLGLLFGDGIWLRLVDLPSALEGRSYAGSGVTTLEVTDEFVPANAGRWRVEVTGGAAIVGPTGDAPDLALDTTALASAYLGGFTFDALFRAGRVSECREGAIADADELFRTNAPAWCSTPF